MITFPRSFGAGLIRKRAHRARVRLKAISSGDPVQDLIAVATQNGYSGDTADLQAMADFAWSRARTDDVGELLEELYYAGLINLPAGMIPS